MGSRYANTGGWFGGGLHTMEAGDRRERMLERVVLTVMGMG